MKTYTAPLVFSFLFVSTFLFSQNERLIIGRTTGKLELGNAVIRTFGFADSLSGQITLPGSYIDIKEGDSLNIDLWNISQGNPISLYSKTINFTQRDKENQIMKTRESIHHMEHGFYSFQAPKAGTYLYYSPENYPFNLQAGMFGVIVIRPKDSITAKPLREVLWCSTEIDTQWHTDTIMGTEYDPSNTAIVLPAYQPDYFLINGKTTSATQGLQALETKQESFLFRLVNAGLYENELFFPQQTKLEFVFGKNTSFKPLPKGYQIVLQPGECLELTAFLGNVSNAEKIRYRVIDPKSKKIRHKIDIPIFY